MDDHVVTLERVEAFTPQRSVPIEELGDSLGLRKYLVRTLRNIHGFDRILDDPALNMFGLVAAAGERVVRALPDPGELRDISAPPRKYAIEYLLDDLSFGDDVFLRPDVDHATRRVDDVGRGLRATKLSELQELGELGTSPRASIVIQSMIQRRRPIVARSKQVHTARLTECNRRDGNSN